MDFTSLITPFIIQSIILGIITYYIRTALQLSNYTKSFETKRWYREIFLPLLPIVLAVVLTHFTASLTGLSLATSVLAGFASSTAFRLFKSFLTKKENEGIK